MAGRILLLAALAMLAACSAPRVLYFGQDFSALYQRRELSTAAAQGPVPLVVRGNPFGGAPAEIAGPTLAAMSRSPSLQPVRLTTGDPGPRQVDYRIILAYGQPFVGAGGLCAAPDAPIAAEPTLSATAAFCIGDKLLSTARGRSLDPVRGPDDPAFAAFLASLVDVLLPPTNPRLFGCGPRPGC
ncbi:MAG: hypothetical protein JNK67_24475 [Alphaproteobacteria bacterium]|nr:hypothetical protein [Alphaproteobacteria bacterium]